MSIGYYYGDTAFQDGFGDDERKSGYAYEYYQRLAPYAGWDYTYRYLTRSEAIEALRNGEVDIVAGINKTPQLEKEFLFSSADMGLDGNPLYFAVNKNRGDLLAELDQAQEDLLTNDPNFLADNRKKYYANSGMTTALTKEEHAWLEEKGSITLGYLSGNLPISGHDDQGKPTGVLGSALPIMEEYLGIPIKTKAFDSRYAMREAIKNNEVDVIFPVYDDAWSREKEDLYQTTPLVEDRIMVAYTGDYDDDVLKRVASTEAAIGQQEFLEQYDPSAELVNYPSRAERKEVVEQQGTGLGMPIALSAARMMNGDIEVESELGKGSTFTATVFLKIAELDESVYEEFIDLPVLIVDDDEVVCESTHIMLRDLGMKPEYVLSGREAVDRLVDAEAAGEQFFAVIIDWIMPGMDGVQTIREIRKRTNGDVPIIVISAYDWTEIEKEARQAGASFFVSKPLFKSRLKQLFVELLGAEPAQKDIEEKLDVSEVDLSGKRGLLAEDNDLNAEVAAAFLEAAGFELERALNGQEAFEMVRDHEPGYYDCVFMDMQMPVMNGLDATRAIRDLPREDTDYDALPIFAMTANAFVDDVRKTKEAGMNGHFAKPLDFTVLLTTLHQQLK